MRIRSFLCVVLLVLTALLSQSSAHAASVFGEVKVVCKYIHGKKSQQCKLYGDDGGKGEKEPPGEARTCTSLGKVIPCVRSGAWWNSSRRCYMAKWSLDNPDLIPGVEPGEGPGAFYECRYAADGSGHSPHMSFLPIWVPDMGRSAEETAVELAAELTLPDPQVRTYYGEGNNLSMHVHIPVWWWIDNTDHVTTESRYGHTITITASPKNSTWRAEGRTESCSDLGREMVFGKDDPDDPTACSFTFSKSGKSIESTIQMTWDLKYTSTAGSGDLGERMSTLTRQDSVCQTQALIVVPGTKLKDRDGCITP